MRKLALAVIFFTVSNSLLAQDSITNSRLTLALQTYYQIKDALAADDNRSARKNATLFIENLNGISYKIISEGNVNTLLIDAGTIANTDNIEKQRVAFANFSANMILLARNQKLTDKPAYIQYCPMKKASWLSNEKDIENPYYGSKMLTCGKVAETIQ
ncbi:MAG: hypothetical protein BGO69_03385 [Bacteroidetes bacterium 46-16]|nr:MAG: hypothetical protein BGO69_03385 [Bacteroidetes bacterium 46-16]